VWWGFGCAVAVGDDAALVLVAVAAADTDDAGAAGPDDPLLGWPAALEPEPAAEVDTDDPPHAASSRTSDPIPVAAAHPLLRITSLQFTVMLVPEGSLQYKTAPGPSSRPARERQQLNATVIGAR
jgi:hypothetical protein